MKTNAAPESRRKPPSKAVRTQAPSLAKDGFRPAGVALALAAAFMACSDRAAAQATGAQVIHGQASLVQQGNSLVITTTNGAGTNHSAINWQSFSVPAGSTTQFNQPNAASTSINRVLGNNPSAIYGTLSSNGRLVLVNPSGIAVGAGAVVDTAGFTASTLRMSDADALAGRLAFGGDGLGGGPLAVDGRILARGGDVVLVAPNLQVGADALVQSAGGATLLAAGQKVEVTGRGLEGIHMEIQAPTDQALSLGTLQGDAVGIFAGQLKHSGLVQATAASADGGKVVLKAHGGDSLVAGRIEAHGLAGRGGSIDVIGQRVGLLAGAFLDASGPQGGGQIRVGGDYQGKNAQVPNAQRSYVDADATLRADATDSGNGGRVIVWADDQTQSFGAISARGGAQGGDGGFVEVSGKHQLQFASPVDTRAPRGTIGTLLLDPDNISVQATGADAAPVAFGDASGTSMTVDVATINNANSTVTLQANLDIDISAPIVMTNAGAGLTAQAGRYLSVFSPITTTGGAVSLFAGDPGASPLQSESGLYLYAGIDTTGGGAAPAGAGVILKSRLSDVGGSSTVISGPANPPASVSINAGTSGAVDISGQRVDISSADIVGGLIGISTTDVSGSISIDGATLKASSGPIWLAAAGSGAPITINGSTLLASGGGISLASDADSVNIWSSSLTTSGADVYISGGAITPASSGDGVYLSAANIQTGGGALNIQGAGAGTQGVSVWSSSFDTAGGAISVLTPGDNVTLWDSTLASAGANIGIDGKGGGVLVVSSTLDSSGGGISIAGGGPNHFGIGVDIQGGSSIHAGIGAVRIDGQSASREGFRMTSATPAATILGSTIEVQGTTSAGSGLPALVVDGESFSASTSMNLRAVNGDLHVINGSLIRNTGAGVMRLEAVATAPTASAPLIWIDSTSKVDNGGVGTGEIQFAADAIAVDGLIDSGTARTMFTPGTTSRAISLGGTDEAGKLNLTQGELSNVTAGVIVVGGGTYDGGLSIDSSLGLGGGALSLIQKSTAGISQAGGATVSVAQLNADAGSVTLAENNAVQMLSGRASSTSGTGFVFSNDGGGDLTVGTVDGISGIRSGAPGAPTPIRLRASAGNLVQTQAVMGSSLAVFAAGSVILENSANNLSSINAAARAGRVSLVNGSTGATSLIASAAGAVAYKGSGHVVIDSIFGNGPATGSSASTSAVAVEAVSIAGGTAAVDIDASANNGSVYLKAGGGDIGAGNAGLGVSTAGGVWAEAPGGSIYLTTPSKAFKVGSLTAAGAASITDSAGAATLDLLSADVGSNLDWSGFATATLGSGGGTISAGGVIGAGGDVLLAGILAPGGSGSIGSMNVSGNFNVLDGATMKYDFNGTSHDSIGVTGNVVFPSAPAGSFVIADASVQPTAGSYTLISGATTGDLPSLSGSVSSASLAFGSLALNVAPPPPAPTSPLSALDQLKLILGDPSLPPPEDPVTTFLTLFTQETDQHAGSPASDSVVDDNQCRR